VIPAAPAVFSRRHDAVLAVAAALGAVLGVALGHSSAQDSLGAALGAALGSVVAALARRRPTSARQRSSRTSLTGESASELRDRLLALIADSVPDAVVLFSDAGTIHYSNPVARELFFEGQAPEGQNFIRLVSAAAAPLREALLGETDVAPLIAHLAALYPELRLPRAPERHGWFDAAQIEQVLINLIKNAREAGSPENEIELRVSIGTDSASEIEVLDRGPGFSTEAMQNSMVPLYTTKPQGSGMGLALSREIVEAHRGSLDVSNRPDGGAWIRVHLAGRAPALSDANRSRLTLTRG
jgi:signal transduction histidine kinase